MTTALYQRLSSADAVLAAWREVRGRARPPETLGGRRDERCGPAVLEIAGTPCAFIVLDGASRFETREDVRWSPAAAYVGAAQAVVEERRAFRLHVRRPDDVAWTLIDEAARIVVSGGLERTGWSAIFHLSAPIPRELVGPLAARGAPPAPLLGEALVEALEATADPLALARRFVAAWFAPSHAPPGEPVGEPVDSTRAPAAVRRWHALWDELHHDRSPLSCHPKDWRYEDGLWFFHREAQSVVRWAVLDEDLHVDDPPVLIELDDGVAPLSPSVSRFALELVIHGTVLLGGTGVHGWSDDAALALARLPSVARRVPLQAWPWPADPTELWTTGRALLSACGEELYLLAPDDDAFERCARGLGLDPAALQATYY